MSCENCGNKRTEEYGQEAIKRIGFSEKINDPSYSKYFKDNNRWSAIFSLILALIAFIGFTLAGENNWDNLGNPESLYIGIGLGTMFILIALFQIIGRTRNDTWDGKVVDKTKTYKKKRNGSGKRPKYDEYLLYEVKIRSDSGKNYTISARDDDTLYNYYKTGDKIVFCNACE